MSEQVENTRASFVAAHAAGAAWVELDVVAAADRSLFLQHDHHYAATPVHELDGQVLTAAGVERFENLTADLPPGLGVNVEVKAQPVTGTGGRHGEALILEQTLAMAETRPVLWSSFDPAIARRGHEAGLPAAWVTRAACPLHEAVMAAADLGLDAVMVHARTTLEAGALTDLNLGWRLVRDTGVAVWCWDVSTPRIPALARAGVIGFCTDDVVAAAAVLRGRLTT